MIAIRSLYVFLCIIGVNSCNSPSKDIVPIDNNEVKVFQIDFERLGVESGVREESGNTVSFKLSMSNSNYDNLVNLSRKKGYAKWTVGDVSYGHVKLFNNGLDQYCYSKKMVENKVLVLCYNKVSESLYLINFDAGW